MCFLKINSHKSLFQIFAIHTHTHTTRPVWLFSILNTSCSPSALPFVPISMPYGQEKVLVVRQKVIAEAPCQKPATGCIVHPVLLLFKWHIQTLNFLMSHKFPGIEWMSSKILRSAANPNFTCLLKADVLLIISFFFLLTYYCILASLTQISYEVQNQMLLWVSASTDL